MSKTPTHRLGAIRAQAQVILPEEGPIPAAAEPPARPALNRPRLINLQPEHVVQGSPIQSRPAFDPENDPEDRQFALSVQKYGVTQPIVVYLLDPEHPQAGYGLVAGHRRLEAARHNRLTVLPALLVARETSSETRDLLTALENLQRRDLQPVEKARQIERLMAAYGYDQKGVAAAIGLSRTQVNDLLRLLDAPAALQQAVNAGTVGVRNARQVARLPDEERQLVLDLAQDGLPVQAALEQIADRPRLDQPEAPPSELPAQGPRLRLRPELEEREPRNTPARDEPVERLLGEQAAEFRAALEERSLPDLLPKAHLPLLAVIWLAHGRDLDAALSAYNQQSRAAKRALEKVCQGLDLLAILQTAAARPEVLGQAVGYVDVAVQGWLGK